MAIHLINGPKEWRRTRGPINLATLRKAEGPFIKDVINFPRCLNTPNSLCRHLFHTLICIYQMRQGLHRFSSLPKIQKGLTKLIKNPKRFCHISNTTNVQGLRSKKLKIPRFFDIKVNFKASIVLTIFLPNVNFWSKYFYMHFRKPQFLNLLRPCTSFIMQRSHTRFGFLTNLERSF